MSTETNKVDQFIKKVNEATERNDVKKKEWLELEKEYLSIIEDNAISRKEKSKIWFKSRYEVVDMICSGVRFEQEQKIKKQRQKEESVMSRTVLVTGSSRGIGRAIAKAFARQGDRVVINYIEQKEAAEKVKEEIIRDGGRAMVVQCDVSKEEQVKKMIEIIEQEFSPVEVLVNNAGIAEMKLFTDIETSTWERMFDVNVKGTYLCCKYVLPNMISQKKGKIVNTSSIWGLVGASCEAHYSATKGAILAFTKALAKEEGPSNIQVNAVAPGAIFTDMISGIDEETLQMVAEETPSGRLGRPEDIAETVVFLASEKADFITGQVISPNGGFVVY